VGFQHLAYDALSLFTETDEAREGYLAFNEKRDPDFDRFR
jgi:1,4-dihydroxy-2-naphthoyl-CoA synthase